MPPLKWSRFLIAGLVLTAVAAMLAPVRPLIGQVLEWTAVVLVFRRAGRLADPRQRVPWRLFGLGGALVLVGGVTRYAIGLATNQVDPFPTVAEPIFFAGYASLIAGARGTGSAPFGRAQPRRRHRGADRERHGRRSSAGRCCSRPTCATARCPPSTGR